MGANKAKVGVSLPCMFLAPTIPEVVRLLVGHAEVEVNKATDDGTRPIDLAYQKSFLEVVLHLLEDSTIVANQANKNGSTPLDIACKSEHLEVVQALLAFSREFFPIPYGYSSTIRSLTFPNSKKIADLIDSYPRDPQGTSRDLKIHVVKNQFKGQKTSVLVRKRIWR